MVNGRPFQPERKPLGPIRRTGPVPSPTDTARLDLDFDLAAALGARSGDRVSVEILYFDGGWAVAGLGGLEKLHRDHEQPWPRMTNRVEFTVP